ncbi:ammonium transporter [Cytophaga aurantiaca]|uniref:ammonium transporter n=1 Tax=Cytophaga aurantiaca TaxID=29530 RepID=UPI00036C5498|nr:ammonium transporter [Cytophaga aurantiaca]
MTTAVLDTVEAAATIIDTIKTVSAIPVDTLVSATLVNATQAQVESISLTSSNIWMMICTALVFIMNLGFASVESGLARSKNTTNILFKNTITPAIGIIIFSLWGLNLMYPGANYAEKIYGFAGFGLEEPLIDGKLDLSYNSGYTYWTNFLFQAMFAATAATIVSGAVAERIKITSYMIFTFIIIGVIYPIVGMWGWGGGWLNVIGGDLPSFYDFAGSTIVHSVGGWAALAGVIVLGPRIGKYVDGKIIPIPGHSMPLATIGVFLLWLGWFGFNGGSVLSADPARTSLVLATTSLSAAAGAIGALITAYVYLKTLDLSMILNGILGGLVGITAGADLMSPNESILIGLISGSVVVFAVVFFDKIKVDDPVGATSVHLVCGILGTLFVGILGDKGFGGSAEGAGFSQLITQLIGITAVAAFVFPVSYIVFTIISKTVGLRVSAKEEIEGLDIAEHGMKAYNIDMDKEY